LCGVKVVSNDKRPRDPPEARRKYDNRADLAGLGPWKLSAKPERAAPEKSRTAVPARPSSTPEDELAAAIQASVSEIAVIWMLHKWSLTRDEPHESLEQQIRNFSSVALETIVSHFPMLGSAKQEHLWLIYFKGLLTAGTHPREDLIKAIKAIEVQNWFRASADPSDTTRPVEPNSGNGTVVRLPRGNLSDAEALEQISSALRQGGTTGN
jgi:hypothetical protein